MRDLSVLCMYLTIGHHPHPLGYLCAKFRFCGDLHCWASQRRKITYSLNQTWSPSLFDAPGLSLWKNWHLLWIVNANIHKTKFTVSSVWHKSILWTAKCLHQLLSLMSSICTRHNETEAGDLQWFYCRTVGRMNEYMTSSWSPRITWRNDINILCCCRCCHD